MNAVQVLCVLLPVKIVSVANLREHYMARHRRAAKHRNTARLMLRQAGSAPGAGPLTITLTRIAPRKISDGDNLQSGFKSVRDGVADWLGVDDGHASLTWRYDQRTGKPREYAAEVVVEWAA